MTSPGTTTSGTTTVFTQPSAPPPPPPPPVSQTKLDWIRDGMKWIVGVAGGLLGLSATYYYDRFDQAPQLSWLLWSAWFLLGLSSIAGIYATFTTWKNLDRTTVGRHLVVSYGVAMWSFMGGFLALAIVLVANVGARPKAKWSADLFAVGLTIPSFDPASAAASDPRFVVAACSARQALADSGSFSALVVGRFDERELSTHAQKTFITNLELAQRRADQIGALLTDSTLCKARPMHYVVAMTGGPRISLPVGMGLAKADSLLAGDRRVEVYGFQSQRR